MGKLKFVCALAFGWMALLTLAVAQNPQWTSNHPPFRIIGNLYYVGSQDLASYLVVTHDGLILINSNLPSSVPQIEHNVEALGFHVRDIKILLISHAHFDHASGSAALKHATGAQYMVMDGDVATVEDGGRSDFKFGRQKNNWYPPARVDRVLHDGDLVKLGGVELVAHKTAGHTKGCTTWTLRVDEAGKPYDVVILGSPNVLSQYKLKGDPNYPTQAADFAQQFRLLDRLKCDVFLASHASAFHMDAKYSKLQAGDKLAFVDPEGYRAYVADRKRAFENALAAANQRAEPNPGRLESPSRNSP